VGFQNESAPGSVRIELPMLSVPSGSAETPTSIKEGRRYPEDYVRGYIPLGQELKIAASLLIPRFGKSPRIADFKLLDGCQMDCNYCDANIRRGNVMTTNEVFSVLGNLKAVGIQMVNLTGGEPTLRRDLPEIISYSSNLDLFTTLNSNGRVGKKDIPDEEDYSYWYTLAEAGLKGVTFSYDGLPPKNNRRIFHLASFAVNKLKIAAGIRMVVTSGNLALMEEAGTTSMRNNILFQAVPAIALGGETSGVAGENGFYPLSYEGRLEFAKICERLEKVRGPFARFLRIPGGYIKEVVKSEKSPPWHCQQPSSHWVSVDAQGNVRVCNDVSLEKKYSLKGSDNPLLNRELHEDIEKTSRACEGCAWLCHWQENQPQWKRSLEHIRMGVTVAGLT